jgi:hypothetical protein
MRETVIYHEKEEEDRREGSLVMAFLVPAQKEIKRRKKGFSCTYTHKSWMGLVERVLYIALADLSQHLSIAD